jgi:hypothetical protein
LCIIDASDNVCAARDGTNENASVGWTMKDRVIARSRLTNAEYGRWRCLRIGEGVLGVGVAQREREREREREVYEQLDAVNYISKAEIIQKRRPSAKRASSNNTTANPIATAHTSLESSPTRVAIPTILHNAERRTSVFGGSQ